MALFDAIYDKLISMKHIKYTTEILLNEKIKNIPQDEREKKAVILYGNKVHLIFYKRITKRTEMMVYFDFDYFFSLSIQMLTSFSLNCVI